MDVGTAALSAWSSGISMYLVAAALGVCGRLDWVTTPEWLTSPWVIGGAVVLAVIELLVDKVAWLDSGWDAVHTVLRPVAGGALFAGAEDVESSVTAALIGAALALSAHLAKAGVRALVNLSPEPVSNIVVSLGEDGTVAGLLALAVANPEIALAVAIGLAVLSTVVGVTMTFLVWRALRRWRQRRADRAVHRRAARALSTPRVSGGADEDQLGGGGPIAARSTDTRSPRSSGRPSF